MLSYASIIFLKAISHLMLVELSVTVPCCSVGSAATAASETGDEALGDGDAAVSATVERQCTEKEAGEMCLITW